MDPKPVVWLIDDEADILDTCKQLLEPKYSIRTFASADHVIQALGAGETPDLFVTDIRMPGMDGLQLAEKLRTLKIEAPIVVVSGYADKDHAIRALSLGVFALMEKPFHPSEYKHVVQRALMERALFKLTEQLLKKYSILIESMEELLGKARNRYIAAENQLPQGHAADSDRKKILNFMKEVMAESKIEETVSRARSEIADALKQRDLLRSQGRG